MKLDGLSLLFDDDGAEQANPRLQFVQQPRQQPAPRYRPGEEPTGRAAPTQAPAIAQPQPTPQLDGLDLLFGESGSNTVQSAPPMAQPAANPNAEPDAPTWIGRRIQDVRGKQDPRFKDLPEFVDTEGARTLPLLAGKAVAGDDQVYGDIVSASLGDKLISRQKDANGYEVVTYRGENGEPVSAYVNKPGLNLEDVNRTAFAAVPYVAGAGVAGKVVQKAGGSALMRILGQSAAAGSTSVANDLLAQPLGSEQGISGQRAVIAAGTGAAAELANTAGQAIYRRFIQEPSLYNRASGELTEKGIDLVRKAGLDPDTVRGDVAREFARTYAKTGNEARAAISASRTADNVPVSQGQMTKDKAQLLREEGMRRGIYGDDAKNVMLGFDTRQRQAVQDAATGSPYQPLTPRANSPQPSVVQTIAPNAKATPTLQSTGEAVQSNTATALRTAKAGERKAWEQARSFGSLEPTDDALKLLPDVFNRRNVGNEVNEQLTPTAFNMLKRVDQFRTGQAPASPVDWLQPTVRRDVDIIRQELYADLRAAANPRDRKAAATVYDAYDEWINEAAGAQLLSGDALGAAATRTARDATKGLKEIFEPREGGKLTAAANVIGKIVKSGDSPESVVQKLFGGQGVTQDGKVLALRNLKSAYTRYLPKDQAKAAVDDLKLAYWTKLVRDRRGEGASDIASTQNMLNALNDAFSNQQSILKELFAPAEIARMRQFKATLERINYRDPNPSGTAYGVASFVKEAISAFMNGIGLNSVPIQMLVRYSGITNVYGSVQARRAVSQAVKPTPTNPLISGTITGTTVPDRSD